MSTRTTFDSTKGALLEFLQAIKDGKTQLPDFQRGWVWDDEHIRSLLASVSLSFPIGALMMLQTGNPDVKFKPRLVEGVELAHPPDPERLILDGQQRLTSLYQALFAKHPVATRDLRGNKVDRWYYVDMAKALDPAADREEAIVGLPADRQVRNFRNEVIRDISTPEREYEEGLFPLAHVFECSDWRTGYNAHWNYDRDKIKEFDAFERELVKRFEQYQIPLILLEKHTPKEAVCQVFEKVNTGGVSLTVFELLTATYAADDYNLREDWDARKKRLNHQRVLQAVENTDFLQAVTLLATYGRRAAQPDAAVTCKRKDVLRLSLEDYRAYAETATRGFERAAKFAHSHKIYAARDLPYGTQLTPLAAIFATLGAQADNDGVRAKLARWYWCGVFGELYGGAIETRFARDFPEVVSWANGGPEPSTVLDASFAPARLQTLKTRNSAAYKGISTILLRDGGMDFRSGDSVDHQSYFDEKIDIHHIFPVDYCKKAGIDSKRADCVVNKTPLSAKTNRMIGGNAPSVYLERLQKSADITPARMDEILGSHVIDPGSIREDDFEQFFEARRRALLDRIQRAMGKPLLEEGAAN